MKLFILLFFSLALVGCNKQATTPSPSDARPISSPVAQEPGVAKFDVCGLLTKPEIEAVQGSPVKDTKSSGRSDGGLRVSQCYYGTAESSKSVSLAITQSDPDSPAKRSLRDFWKQTFGRFEGEAKEREGDEEKRKSLGEEEEKSVPPKKIAGIGDGAYWTGNRVGGALYVLKNDAFIRISVGGPDNEETKIDKSKALAQKALERL